MVDHAPECTIVVMLCIWKLRFCVLLAVFIDERRATELQDELLSTGALEILGAPSTSWKTKSGEDMNWCQWNGRIQMLTRERLRPLAERNTTLVASIAKSLNGYMEEQGGIAIPLPGYDGCPINELAHRCSIGCGAATRWMESCAHANCTDAFGNQWQTWAGDDARGARVVVESLLSCGLDPDDGKYAVPVAGVFERLLSTRQGLSDVVASCLAAYSQEVLDDLALDSPKVPEMISRIRAAAVAIQA